MQRPQLTLVRPARRGPTSRGLVAWPRHAPFCRGGARPAARHPPPGLPPQLRRPRPGGVAWCAGAINCTLRERFRRARGACVTGRCAAAGGAAAQRRAARCHSLGRSAGPGPCTLHWSGPAAAPSLYVDILRSLPPPPPALFTCHLCHRPQPLSIPAPPSLPALFARRPRPARVTGGTLWRRHDKAEQEQAARGSPVHASKVELEGWRAEQQRRQTGSRTEAAQPAPGTGRSRAAANKPWRITRRAAAAPRRAALPSHYRAPTCATAHPSSACSAPSRAVMLRTTIF